jgi:hypothetical protein
MPPSGKLVTAECDAPAEAGDVYEDGHILTLAPSTRPVPAEPHPPQTGGLPDSSRASHAREVVPVVFEAPVAIDAAAPLVSSEPHTGKDWAVANEPMEAGKDTGMSEGFEEAWSLAGIGGETASLLPLICYGAAPDWEQEIVWGDQHGDDSDDSLHLQQQATPASNNARVAPRQCDEQGLLWDTESDEEASSHVALLAKPTEAEQMARSRKALIRRASKRCEERCFGSRSIERGWDNAQPMEGAPATTAHWRRAHAMHGNVGRSLAVEDHENGAATTAEGWEKELRTRSEDGMNSSDLAGAAGHEKQEQDDEKIGALKLDGLRLHEGIPQQAAVIEAGVSCGMGGQKHLAWLVF